MGRPDKMTLGSLTGLRAPAAFIVFVYHMNWMAPGLAAAGHEFAASILERVALKGYVGVSFFFVLSGFVLAWSQRASEPATSFWWRRATRVYPNHIVTWLVAGGLVLVGIIPTPPIGAAFANLLLLPHVFVPGAEWTVMNDPSWSIEVEAVFYLCFPLIFTKVLRAPDGGVKRWIVVSAGLLIGAPILAVMTGQGQNEEIWRLLYFFPLSRLPEFIVGVGLGVLAGRNRLPRIDVRLAWALVVVAFGLCIVAPVPLTFAALTLIPFGVLIIAHERRDVAGERSRLAGRTWVHLGVTSYAFYLCHYLVIRTVQWANDGAPIGIEQALVFTAISFAGSLAAAEVLHRFVEVPAMHRLRRRGPRSRERTVPGP